MSSKRRRYLRRAALIAARSTTVQARTDISQLAPRYLPDAWRPLNEANHLAFLNGITKRDARILLQDRLTLQLVTRRLRQLGLRVA